MTPQELRSEIPLFDSIIYADSSATSLTPNCIIGEVTRTLKEFGVNVERGGYALAHTANKEWEEGRNLTAKLLLNCPPTELIFTRNFTEAANLVSFALQNALSERCENEVTSHPRIINWELRDNIVTTSSEHHSNFLPWMRLAKNVSAEFRVVGPRRDGIIEPDTLAEQIDGNTKFCAFQHISNATGAIQPVQEIVKAIKKRNPMTLIFIDGSQAAGHRKIAFHELGCNFYGFSGHKGPLGPHGTGGVAVQEEILKIMEPANLGGGTVTDVTLKDYLLKNELYYKRFDGGTAFVPGLVALGAGASLVARQIGFDKIEEHEKNLVRELISGLKEIKDVEIYGPENLALRAGIVSFNIKGWLCHDVSLALDEEWKILTRAGHHCCIPLMRFLNILEPYGGCCRVSFHYYNTLDDVKAIISAVRRLAG